MNRWTLEKRMEEKRVFSHRFTRFCGLIKGNAWYRLTLPWTCVVFKSRRKNGKKIIND